MLLEQFNEHLSSGGVQSRDKNFLSDSQFCKSSISDTHLLPISDCQRDGTSTINCVQSAFPDSELLS